MSSSPNRRYLPAIDHLRGGAALLIVFYHGWWLIAPHLLHGRAFDPGKWEEASNPLWALLIEGHTAVSLFMVLSGFIFTVGTWGSRIYYWRFMRNRLLRIYPLFIAITVIAAVADPRNLTLAGVAKTLLLCTNCDGAFGAAPYTSMFWTVAVEFQFYVLFPLLLVILNRWGLTGLGLVAGAFLVIRLVMLLHGSNMRDLAYETLPGRIEQFLLGMVAARIYLTRAAVYRRRLSLWAAPILAAQLCLLFAFNRVGGGWPTVVWWKLLWPMVEGAGWAGFIVCYTVAAHSARNGIWRGLQALGTISYSVYLLHFVVVVAVVRAGLFMTLTGDGAIDALITTFVVVVPPVLILSAISYRLVERPFLDLRKTYVIPAREGLSEHHLQAAGPQV